jgi:predicted anti-sigma-YlaC factor YlaD
LNIACDKARDLIHDVLDGDVKREHRVLLQTHLGGCSACRAYHAQMLHLCAAVRSLPLHETPLPASQLARVAAVSSTAPGFWEVAKGLALPWVNRLRAQRRLRWLLTAVLLAFALGWTTLIVFSAAGFLFFGLEGARLVWMLALSLAEAFRVSASALALTSSSLLPALAALGMLEAAVLILAWIAWLRKRAPVLLLV